MELFLIIKTVIKCDYLFIYIYGQMSYFTNMKFTLNVSNTVAYMVDYGAALYVLSTFFLKDAIVPLKRSMLL